MNSRIKILSGPNLETMKSIPDASVQCIVTSPPYWQLRSYLKKDHPLKVHEIGLEDTPEKYIASLVAVFRECKRILRDDGTLWVNIGDSYARMQDSNVPQTKNPECVPPVASGRIKNAGLKPKDLVGIPWILAFALRADGWYLHSDMIWAKGISCCDTYAGSCMPESVTDRPTKSHEYVFLFSKSQNYFYDQEAVKEQGTFPAGTPAAKGSEKRLNGDGVNARPAEYAVYSGMRNLRSVLAINPEPSGYEHFATMPTRLVKLCLQAGMSVKGCCPHCGAPWERIVESEPATSKECPSTQAAHNARGGTGVPVGTVGKSGSGRINGTTKQTGWKPTCECSHGELKRCVAFDPFGGTGTTAECAVELGHDAIMCELNPEYVSIAEERTNKTPGFALA